MTLVNNICPMQIAIMRLSSSFPPLLESTIDHHRYNVKEEKKSSWKFGLGGWLDRGLKLGEERRRWKEACAGEMGVRVVGYEGERKHEKGWRIHVDF